jgi:hypothetical protein
MRFLDDMQNYTAQNARLPTLPAARVVAAGTANDGPLYIHLHDGTEPSSTSGIEPAIGEMSEVEERLSDLERAVAAMAQAQGMGLPDDQIGEGEVNQFPDDPDDPGDILAQAAEEQIANSTDALPDDPQSINAKNSAYWQGKGGTTTGGSQSLPPSSRKAESGGYLPNATGSISGNRRLSTTAKVPEARGRTWGTSDRAAMQRADFWRDQRLATNAAIGKIQQTLQTRWGR